MLQEIRKANDGFYNFQILPDDFYPRTLLFSPVSTEQRGIPDESIDYHNERPRNESTSTPLDVIHTQLMTYANEYLTRLQHEALLPHSFTPSSLLPERIAYAWCSPLLYRQLVEFLQEQISNVATTISITQTSSLLTPLQNSLQAAVTLHALCTLHQGLQRDVESIQCMHDYINEMIHNDSYMQILPNPILSYFESLESTLLRMCHDSVSSIKSSGNESPRLIEENPLSESEKEVSPEQEENQEDQEDQEDPPRTVIIIDDSLVQQHHLLQ